MLLPGSVPAPACAQAPTCSHLRRQRDTFSILLLHINAPYLFIAGPAGELDKQELAFLADFVQVMIFQAHQLECYAAVTFCNWQLQLQ